VYQAAGQLDAAEDAYRKSLATWTRLGDVAGQANTLGQLGLFYDNDLGRTEDAVVLIQQATNKFIEIGDVANEGRTRSNLASRLIKLGRLDEARQEIIHAIQCKEQFGYAAEPWSSWWILATVEMNDGNFLAAKEANKKAIQCYVSYRRDGGENHYPSGRISFSVTKALHAGDSLNATTSLQQLVARPDVIGPISTFIQALQAIVSGSRDPALADAPDLDYMMAAEILFLLETLEKQDRV
jgi:tetratricopeptide (TPR) repeat protein